MMIDQQAGIKRITLYENKDISFTFWDVNNERAITNILSAGNVISIDYNQKPEFEETVKISKSGEILFKYLLKYFILNYTTDDLLSIEMILNSIYGWCPLIEYYDGTIKFYNSILYLDETSIKQQKEMSFELELNTRVDSSEKFYEFTANVDTTPIYRADTTLLTADTTFYTADYAL